MKDLQGFAWKAVILLCSLLLAACSDDYYGDTSFSVGEITLSAEFLGYGKDFDENEDVLVKKYSSGNLRTFIDFDSYPDNPNPYIIKTSTTGADNRSSNIIKMTLTFPSAEIETIKMSIESDAEHISSFYYNTFLGETEIKKENLKAGDSEISVSTEIDKIIIYIESPKFYNNKQVNNYFKFNYCLPYGA